MLIAVVSRPVGELPRMSARVGSPYMDGNDTTLAGAEIKTKYALDLMRTHKPGFMTLHLSSLDEEEHLHGPFSPEAENACSD